MDMPREFDVVCQLEANDDLLPDNQAHLFVEIYDRLPVLLVEDSAESAESDTPFLLAALGARKTDTKREWRSVFEPTVIDSRALAATDLNRFRCVLIANPKSLQPAELTGSIGRWRSPAGASTGTTGCSGGMGARRL